MAFIENIGYIIVGAAITWVAEYVRDFLERANVKFGKIIIEQFERSVRIAFNVKHVGGKLPVTNSIGYLTLDCDDLSKFSLGKVEGKCSLSSVCSLCNGKEYLAPYGSRALQGVLPWTLPVKAGEGLDSLPYKHVTHIPVGGHVKLLLFDLYKVKLFDYEGNKLMERERFFLVKVHSEYGEIYYPRICLKLPMAEKPNLRALSFRIVIAGENLRKIPSAELKIIATSRDYLLKYREKDYRLSELLEKQRWLKLVPRREIY